MAGSGIKSKEEECGKTGDTGEEKYKEKVWLTSESNADKVKEMKSKLVGKLKQFKAMAEIARIFRLEGFEGRVVDFIGGLWILLSLNPEEQKKLKKNECLMSWFEDVIPWSEDFRVEERLTRIAISGVPLVVWTDDSFIKIAERWGKRVSMEACALGEVDGTVVRVCIRTSIQKLIFGSEEIMVDGKPEVIRIMECGDIMVPNAGCRHDQIDPDDDLEEGEFTVDDMVEDEDSDGNNSKSEFLSVGEKEGEQSERFDESDVDMFENPTCGGGKHQRRMH